MALLTVAGCGNCGYGCCCGCNRKDNCYLCSYDKYHISACHYLEKYNREKYPYHYVCWPCKKTWKVSFLDRRNSETKEKDNNYHKTGQCPSNWCRPQCPQCGEDGERVPYSFRGPKQKDIKGWELTKKLFNYEGIINKKGYLSGRWRPGNMVHEEDRIRNMIWLPKKLSEYDDWVVFMNTTKIPHEYKSKRAKKKENKLIDKKNKMIEKEEKIKAMKEKAMKKKYDKETDEDYVKRKDEEYMKRMKSIYW